jgi:hydroxyacylglutathione hydrolase
MNRKILKALMVLIISTTLVSCGAKDPVLVDSDTLRVTLLSSGGANVYIVDRNDKRIMIDSGNPGDELVFENMMQEQGIAPDSIDYLILTHAHLDHAGTAAHFQEKWGIPVIGGSGDQPMLDREGQADICPTSLLAELIRWMGKGRRYRSLQLDIPIEDNGEFDMAELGINGKILPLPGHTEGSLVITFDDQVFVGDLIRGSLTGAEEPATHFFMCDLADNRARIGELLSKPELQRWHPGHMGSFDVDAVRTYLAAATGSGALE